MKKAKRCSPKVILTLLLLLFFQGAQAQSAKEKIEKLLENRKAEVSISLLSMDSKKSFHFNETKRMPMQSVFKFPIALHVLHLIDEKELFLSYPIELTTRNLLPNTHSPLRDKYPRGRVKVPIADLLYYMVSLSDNNACDILLRLTGGAQETENYIHRLGIREFKMPYNEEQMHQDWNHQYSNYSTTKSLVELLQLFHEGKILSEPATSYLYSVMLDTQTGKDKIKKYLPKGVTAHKTGSSGQNSEGLTGAENDIALIKAADGTTYALAVLISNSYESPEWNNELIAKVSQLLYEAYPQLEK